jgi:beta-xylosidase
VALPRCIQQSGIDTIQVWPLYIESQQVILAATQFVISMNRFVKDPEANTVPSQEMQDLHSRIDSVVTLTNEGAHPDLSQATDPETTAARALRCMSTVKLNR